MSAGSNNPIFIEQQLDALKEYNKNIEKYSDELQSILINISKDTEKLSDIFEQNFPINARIILSYINKVNDDINLLKHSTDFNEFTQLIDKLNNDTDDLSKYFHQQYLKTVDNG